jgi:hypothetical protein
MFKYLFKITETNPIKSIVQITLIIVLFIALASLILIFAIPINKEYSHSHYCGNPRTDYKRAINWANMVLERENALNGKIDYISEQELAKIFIDGMKAEKVYNVNIEYLKPKKQGLPKEYAGMPAWETPDYKLFVIRKFEKGCNTVNNDDVEQSSCIIEVDVNASHSPNLPQKDRFKLIVDGNRNHVLPAKEDWEKFLKKN